MLDLKRHYLPQREELLEAMGAGLETQFLS
jgi:hypothetical protein